MNMFDKLSHLLQDTLFFIGCVTIGFVAVALVFK